MNRISIEHTLKLLKENIDIGLDLKSLSFLINDGYITPSIVIQDEVLIPVHKYDPENNECDVSECIVLEGQSEFLDCHIKALTINEKVINISIVSEQNDTAYYIGCWSDYPRTVSSSVLTLEYDVASNFIWFDEDEVNEFINVKISMPNKFVILNYLMNLQIKIWVAKFVQQLISGIGLLLKEKKLGIIHRKILC